jgi:hypothetical protein
MAYEGFDKLKEKPKGKGKKKFNKAAAKGKSMRGMKAKGQAEALEGM